MKRYKVQLIQIAQGYEAGGHRGMFLTADLHTQIGTMAVVPQIADAVEIPVIAAGGIADGRGIAAALALGASGVQIGTAYLFTDEADVNPLYCDALQSAKDTPSSLTNVFSGRPAAVWRTGSCGKSDLFRTKFRLFWRGLPPSHRFGPRPKAQSAGISAPIIAGRPARLADRLRLPN